MKNGFINRFTDGLRLSHIPITIRAEVDPVLLLVAHIISDVAVTNLIAASFARDPWLEGHDIPDHWDAESTA